MKPACKQKKRGRPRQKAARSRKGFVGAALSGLGKVAGKVVKVAGKAYKVAKPGYQTYSTTKKIGEGDTVGLIREGVTTAVSKLAPILGIASVAGVITDAIRKKGAPYYPPHMWKGGIPGQPLHLHNQVHKKTCRRTNWGRECMLPHQWPKWKKKWPLVK
jgi:hypothetical protein